METRWLDEDERGAWVRLVAVVELLPGVLDSQLRRDAGLTHFEYFVLAMLSEAPERTLRMTALAQRTNATLPRLSHVVRRLEERGLVERFPCPEDGRATNARSPTPGGTRSSAAAPGHVDDRAPPRPRRPHARAVDQLADIGDALLDAARPRRADDRAVRPRAGRVGGGRGGLCASGGRSSTLGRGDEEVVAEQPGGVVATLEVPQPGEVGGREGPLQPRQTRCRSRSSGSCPTGAAPAAPSPRRTGRSRRTRSPRSPRCGRRTPSRRAARRRPRRPPRGSEKKYDAGVEQAGDRGGDSGVMSAQPPSGRSAPPGPGAPRRWAPDAPAYASARPAAARAARPRERLQSPTIVSGSAESTAIIACAILGRPGRPPEEERPVTARSAASVAASPPLEEVGVSLASNASCAKQISPTALRDDLERVAIPRLAPAPRTPQNRSGCSSRVACTTRRRRAPPRPRRGGRS